MGNEAEETVAAANGIEDNTQDMAQAMEEFESSFKTMNVGDFLTGRVVAITSEGIMVDVGYKTEGLVPNNQISFDNNVTAADVVKIGDEINVVVQKVEDPEGNLILSKKRADNDAAWRKILHAKETGETLSATCTEAVKGGLIVDIGLRGFVPASHVDLRPVHNLEELVGESLELKVIEVDKPRRKVVLSRKECIKEAREKAKAKALANLQEGQIVTGKVARLQKFGAFVDLGGIDGLIHISELSWKHIKDAKEVVQPGQQVEVLVLKIDPTPDKERISLSLRRARPDVWQTVGDRFHVGDIVKARIVRFANNKWTFAELEDGIDALIPINEIANRHIGHPNEVLKIDQEVEAKITELRPENRRMVLSIKAATPVEKEASNNGGRMRHSEGGTGTSIGDLFPNLANMASTTEEK